MKYRGYNIRTVEAIDLLRHNYTTNQADKCRGVYCELYNVSDDYFCERIGDFTLAEGHEIPDITDRAVEKAIRDYVDEHILGLDCVKNEVITERKNDLVGKLVSWIGEEQAGEELYDTLSDYIGMTDDEIRACGFKSLVPYFNKAEYAQTIAEYMIFTATDNTTTGNWHFTFEELGDRYAVNLSKDSEMVDMITDELNKNGEMISELEVYGKEFDITFYLDYCPFAREEEDEDFEYEQQM